MRGISLEALDVGATNVPHYFRCPISLDLMRDPVTVSTGHTYDRSSIEAWIATGNTTCPVTRAQLDNLHVIPNHTLRRLIQDWCPSSGVTRIPTPKQPADPTTVRSLLSQASSESTQMGIRVAALSRLRRLAVESDKNRDVIMSQNVTGILVPVLFSRTESNCELAFESLTVVSMLSLRESECVYVASEPERIKYLTSLLFDDSTDVRVNSATVIEMVITGTRSTELREKVAGSDDVFEGVVGIINCSFSHPRALRVGIRTLLALCLGRPQRHMAVAAGAVPALIDKMTDLEKHDAERALAVVELLCRTPSGCEAFAAHALTVPILVKAVLRVSERATEFAAGALLAVCTTTEECRKEAVAAGAMTRMLLVVQSECTERAKRKAQSLLKLLRESWHGHCQMRSLDEYHGCSDVIPF